jgi:glycerate kinase
MVSRPLRHGRAEISCFAKSRRAAKDRRVPRRYLIAPDKFKGSLTAAEAAAAIAKGIRRRDAAAIFDICPIADGGEGFMETLAAATGGTWIRCPAVDPLGREIDSRYVLAATPAGPTAILEMAETAGLWRLAAGERDPLRTTTRGVGMQILHAVRERGAGRIVLGLGGSATNDAGAGMAAALGIRFLDADGREIDPVPENLAKLQSIDATRRTALPPVTAACDVDNPLLGARGATAIFSAQKGASAATKPILEAALSRLVETAGGGGSALVPGAGAAGGLGFGLLHFAGARLESGFDLLADLLDLRSRVEAAGHVITGEGSLDHQSLSGKGPVALARLAKALGKPVACFCGIADAEARASGIFDSLHALADSGLPSQTLMENAAALLAEMAATSDFHHS